MLESLIASGVIALCCFVGESDEAGCRMVRTCVPGHPVCKEVCNYVWVAASAATPGIPKPYAIPGAMVGGMTQEYVCNRVCEPVEHCTYKEECSQHIYNGQSG